MKPQSLPSDELSELASLPEVLSDEEIRERAAAYAQQIYEQQLETYKAQREQVLAAHLAQEEYERQRVAYEEACRSYYTQQPEPSVECVVPETEEQAYAAGMAEPEPVGVDAGGVTANVFFEPEILPESENVPEEPVSEPFFASVGVPAPEVFSEAKPEENPQPDPTPPNAPVVVPRFPLFRVFFIIVCLAFLSAEGYILFSEDPRFEIQRNRFFTAIGWENAVTKSGADASGAIETDAKKTRAVPDYPRPQKIAEPVVEEPLVVPNTEEEEPEETDEIFEEDETEFDD